MRYARNHKTVAENNTTFFATLTAYVLGFTPKSDSQNQTTCWIFLTFIAINLYRKKFSLNKHPIPKDLCFGFTVKDHANGKKEGPASKK